MFLRNYFMEQSPGQADRCSAGQSGKGLYLYVVDTLFGSQLTEVLVVSLSLSIKLQSQYVQQATNTSDSPKFYHSTLLIEFLTAS